jgi:hypothetical protein
MSFRLRLTVLVSLAVAVAIAGTSVLVYFTYKHELYSQVDSQLNDATAQLPAKVAVHVRAGGIFATTARARRLLEHPPQLLNGQTQIVLPGSFQALQVTIVPGPNATFYSAPRFSNQTVGGIRSRVLTIGLGG